VTLPQTPDATDPSDPAVRDVDVDGELARAVAESGSGRLSREQLTRILTLAGRSARAAGVQAVASGRWLADLGLEVAAHVPVRDQATLKAHFDGLEGPLLAGALVRNASRTTATVGGITGAIATASQTTPATWATLPIELLAETLVVVAIEMKLLGELHEVAGQGVRGTIGQRGTAIATAWSESRGLRPSDLVTRPLRATAATLVGRESRSQLTGMLQRKMLKRAGRNLTSFVPLMAGAAAGAELNRRATRALGRKVASSLGIEPPR
jgi:hypothetical protein